MTNGGRRRQKSGTSESPEVKDMSQPVGFGPLES
jgi:hypothetical protein